MSESSSEHRHTRAGSTAAIDDPRRGSLPLEDYGVVGDMETVAVAGRSGAIDWFCWPRVDSPALFGALLDDDGGRWSIHPLDGGDTGRDQAGRQLYLSGTNVLITRFHTPTGIAEIEDLMAVDGRRRLVRRVSCLRGAVRMETELTPRPDYGRATVEITVDGHSAELSWPDDALLLRASIGLTVDEGSSSLRGEFEVREGECAVFDLGPPIGGPEHAGSAPTSTASDHDLVDEIAELILMTIEFWKEWNERSTYRGRWRQAVERSALVLKLLTHRETGGVVAAATTSIPELLGGDRNWDYRYVWIRDAAFTVYALLELGHRSEADAFATWLVARLDGCEAHDPPLVPVYDLDGRRGVPEAELDHWAGYARSRPVRIGNAAGDQLQLDIYGELIDSLYLTDQHGDGLSLAAWDHVRTLVDYVVDHWEDADRGMWEVRDRDDRHTSSLLMCWVAVERAIRMAAHRGRPADLERWRSCRDEIHETVRREGWNEELAAFTRTLGGCDVDASILLAPLVKFLPGDDPQWASTLDAVGEQLAHGPLVDRYDTDVVDDGLDGGEGAFAICSFWYVEALTRAGRVDEARRLFDRLLTYAGPLGLYAEQIGADGRQLGNFPQAFTHLALISAAVHLDEALDARRT